MISIKNLTLSYGSSPVINRLNLDLQTGLIHGLVGLNGSGKTTLLNSLNGLVKPSTGSLCFKENPLSKKDISFLPTENYFYPNIAGIEYLNLFRNDDFKTEEWNQLFHLPLNQIIDGYSTGMKKKLALLGVLKQNKPILILDEPFNGLDIETSRTLHSILSKLRLKGKTILVTSHILDSLTDLCDQIHYLEEGHVKFTKEKSEFEVFKQEIYESLDLKNNNALNTLI